MHSAHHSAHKLLFILSLIIKPFNKIEQAYHSEGFHYDVAGRYVHVHDNDPAVSMWHQFGMMKGKIITVKVSCRI